MHFSLHTASYTRVPCLWRGENTALSKTVTATTLQIVEGLQIVKSCVDKMITLLSVEANLRDYIFLSLKWLRSI